MNGDNVVAAILFGADRTVAGQHVLMAEAATEPLALTFGGNPRLVLCQIPEEIWRNLVELNRQMMRRKTQRRRADMCGWLLPGRKGRYASLRYATNCGLGQSRRMESSTLNCQAVKRVVRPMSGFKSFESGAVTIAGIQPMHMICPFLITNELRMARHFCSRAG